MNWNLKKYLGGKETNEKKYLPDIVKQPENYPMRVPLKQYRKEIINLPREKIAPVYRENSPIKKTENEYISKQPAYYPPKAPAKPVVKMATNPPQNRKVQNYRTNSAITNTQQKHISTGDSRARRIVKTGRYDMDKYKNYPGELENTFQNEGVSVKPPVRDNPPVDSSTEYTTEPSYYRKKEGLLSKLKRWAIEAAVIGGLIYLVSSCAECSTQKPGVNLENKVLTENVKR